MDMEHDQLLGVEIRHLVALAAIARTGSFSRAASALGYAQSAVSQQIGTLERAVGHRLIERGRGPQPVSLTEAGTIVLRHADRVQARLGALRADLDALDAGELGTLRVGVFQSASSRLLPAVLARFRESWPRIEVQLHSEHDSRRTDQRVLAGELDLAFSVVIALPEAIVATELLVDPYVALVPPTSRLADLHELDLAVLDGADLISQPPNDSCNLLVDRALATAGATPRVVFRSDDNMTVQRLVGTGIGSAIVPLLTVERDTGPTAAVMIPLAPGSAFERRIAMIWHRDRTRSAAARGFVDVAVEVASTTFAR